MSELSLKLTKLQEQNTFTKKYMYDNQTGTKEPPASKHKDISKRTRYHNPYKADCILVHLKDISTK